MKLLLLSDIGHKPTRLGYLKNNGRGSGPHYIAEVARQNGVESTNVDYWKEWPREQLINCILEWFNDDSECWIALSGSIDGASLDDFKQLVADVKKQLPCLKVMLGGFRVPVGSSDWVDISFIGRSVNIFQKWLRKEDISEFLFSDSPLTYKNSSGKILEDPVSPIIQAGDFWSDREVLTVEMALGCKFNCSFCGYDFRNNLVPILSSRERLKQSLTTAHQLTGMTRFVLADDTTNEVDEKLELLADVVEELDFEPDFMGFVRLDIVGAKPHQIELLRRARVNTVFFGIESLNPSVTKMLRKGGKPEKNYRTLERFRDEFPECFTYGNFIVGLTGDSEKDIWYHAERIAAEKLLTSAGSNPLRLYENLANPDVMSDIDLDPAKFGYTVIDTDVEWKELGYNSKKWRNEWTSYDDSAVLNDKLDSFFRDNLTSVYTAHEIQNVKSIMPDQELGWYNDKIHLLNRSRDKIVRQYIKDKSEWMMSINSSRIKILEIDNV